MIVHVPTPKLDTMLSMWTSETIRTFAYSNPLPAPCMESSPLRLVRRSLAPVLCNFSVSPPMRHLLLIATLLTACTVQAVPVQHRIYSSPIGPTRESPPLPSKLINP